MADININVRGDASSGTAAMESVNSSLGKSVVAWQEVANAAKKAGQFILDAVKAYAESERITRQLTRVAGEYTDELEAQAQALSRVNAVDDDVIKQQQVLLAQWGGVGAATSKVTQAVLDYAAATGQDAVGATQDLIRNVESGGVGMAKMGIHFEATGNKSKDLAALVDALGKKFGGAGAADAQSLSGQIRTAEIAFDDLKKTIGGFFGAVEAKLGVLEKLAGAIRGITAGITNADGVVGTIDALNPLGGMAQNAYLGATGQLGKGPALTDAGLPGIGSVTGLTNKGMKALQAAAAAATAQSDLDDKSLERTKKFYDDLDSIEERALEQEEQRYADELKLSADRVEADIKEANERVKVRADMLAKIEKENAEAAERADKAAAEQQKRGAKEQADRVADQAREWKNAGDQIGAAFVNALADQLSKLAAGEEFDVAVFVGDILAATIAIAGNVIGTAYGNPALGAAIGNLAAAGVRAGAGAISGAQKRDKALRSGARYHDGGWVGGLPSYHDGGWINGQEQVALLRRNERVLTPEEVGVMGGPSSVDAMAKGGKRGPTMNLYISAIDTQGAAEAAVGGLGRGLREAARTGRGALPILLEMNPR